MPAQYFSVVTLQGQAQIAAALSGQGNVVLAELAAGDGNGQPTTPVTNQTTLVHQVWRGAITSVARDPAHPTQVIVTATIPGSAGPAIIRELGIYASNGELVAVANYPATELAAPGQGAVTDILVEFVFVVDTAAPVTVQINSSSFVPLAQMMRAPFIGIDTFALAPPANPNAGDLVVVGTPLPHDQNTPAPTGVFTAHADEFGQWNGTGWLFCAAPLETIVGNAADGRQYKRTGTGWVEWKATANVAGPVTNVDIVNVMQATPLPELVANGANNAVPSGVMTKIGAYAANPVNTIPGVTFANGTVTIGAGGGGFYQIEVNGMTALQNSASGFNHEIEIATSKGVWTQVLYQSATSPVGVIPAMSKKVRLAQGDTVACYVYHNTGRSEVVQTAMSLTRLAA